MTMSFSSPRPDTSASNLSTSAVARALAALSQSSKFNIPSSVASPTNSPSSNRRPFFFRGNSNKSISSTETNGLGGSKHRSGHDRNDLQVRFSDVNQIIPNNDAPITEDEQANYFITSDDVKRFEKDRLLTMHMFLRRKQAGTIRLWNDDLDSIRGLEDFFHPIKTEKQRKLHIKCVLQEQEKCKANAVTSQQQQQALNTASQEFNSTHNSYNIYALAEAAKRTSKESRKESQMRGKRDALCGFHQPSQRLVIKLKSLVE